jgi:hypothetical protein
VACRALHAALDRGQPLDVAVAAVSPVPFPITPRRAANAAARAAEYIAERIGEQAQALREGLGHFEEYPSSRGM